MSSFFIYLFLILKKNKLSLFSERSFVCCMRTSKAFRQHHAGGCGTMLVRGRFHYFPQPCRRSSSHLLPDRPLFVALCTPTVDQVPSCHSHLCQSFSSLHTLDMTFVQLSDRCVITKIAITRRRLSLRRLSSSQCFVRFWLRGGGHGGPVMVQSHSP